jgi:hypothetical protein
MPQIGPRPELAYAYAEACERGFDLAAAEITDAIESDRVATPGVIHERDALLWIAVAAVSGLAAGLGISPAELLTDFGMEYTAKIRERLVTSGTPEISTPKER